MAKGVFDDDIRRAAIEIASLTAAPPAAPPEAEEDAAIVGAGRVLQAAGAAAARLKHTVKARAAAPDASFSDLLREAADRETPAEPSFSDLLREAADREAGARAAAAAGGPVGPHPRGGGSRRDVVLRACDVRTVRRGSADRVMRVMGGFLRSGQVKIKKNRRQ